MNERPDLSPEKLRKDAEQLLGRYQDPSVLVARLLRDLRQHRQTEEAIREGYSHTSSILEEDIDRARVYGLMDALDMLKRMTPAPSTRLTYEGCRGQLARQLRARIKHEEDGWT